MASSRHAKGVREFLTLIGEAPCTSAVVKTLKEARYEPETWVTELKGMQREGQLLGFVAPHDRRGRRDQRGRARSPEAMAPRQRGRVR